VSPAEIFRSGLFIASKGERRKERKKEKQKEKLNNRSNEVEKRTNYKRVEKVIMTVQKKDIFPLSTFESITQFNKAASNQMQTKKI
jgi:hypothetical protein